MLVPQQLQERSRSTSERVHAIRYALGFHPDRHRCRTLRTLDEHERIAPGQAARAPELVAAHEHQTWPHTTRPQVGDDPTPRIGLVG